MVGGASQLPFPTNMHTSLIAKLNRISSGTRTRTQPLRFVICIWTFRRVFARHLCSTTWRKCSKIVAKSEWEWEWEWKCYAPIHRPDNDGDVIMPKDPTAVQNNNTLEWNARGGKTTIEIPFPILNLPQIHTDCVSSVI